MKNVFRLMLAAVLTASLAACASKTEETKAAETAAAETAAPAMTSQTAETAAAAAQASIANPMTEISDPAEFSRQLGIEIDTSALLGKKKMFIIGGKVAECQVDFDVMETKGVVYSLRATKDADAAENLHGIYDSTLQEISDFDKTCDRGTFTVTLAVNEAGDIAVYTWNIDGIWYALTVQGTPTGEEIAVILNCSLYAAVGLTQEAGEAAAEEAAEEEEESWYGLSEDGTVLTVCLRANATTGYQWSCRIRDEQCLEKISQEYVEDAHAEGMTGVGGVWTADFRVPQGFKDESGVSGRSNDITFTYARDWEGEGIPSKAVDLLIHGRTMEIMGIHEPDLTTPMAEDGEYGITMAFTDMLEQNELSFYALVGFPEVFAFTDEDVRSIEAGDVIPLGQFGLYDITVEKKEPLGEDAIGINDVERFEFDKNLNAWVIRGLDDDIYMYNREMRQVHFTNETQIDDGMEEILKTGNTGTIYDKMRSYRNITGKITVKDGQVSYIRINYHP